MAAEDDETARTAVKTYVPAYQRDSWDEHAEDLDMSRSEFVRSMVQAGRKDFDPRGSAAETGEQTRSESGAQTESVSGGIEDRILETLEDGPQSWDDLFEAVAGDIEDRLEDTLASLQDANRVQYNGRTGGYVLIE